MPHNIIFYFHLRYFQVSNSLNFLQSTLILSFYIDIVLALSISMDIPESSNYAGDLCNYRFIFGHIHLVLWCMRAWMLSNDLGMNFSMDSGMTIWTDGRWSWLYWGLCGFNLPNFICRVNLSNVCLKAQVEFFFKLRWHRSRCCHRLGRQKCGTINLIPAELFKGTAKIYLQSAAFRTLRHTHPMIQPVAHACNVPCSCNENYNGHLHFTNNNSSNPCYNFQLNH